jgi:4-hydroxybutyrate CoA-transferase
VGTDLTQPAGVAERRRGARRLLSGLDSAQVVAAMFPQQPDGLLAALIEVGLERDVRLRLLVADIEGSFRFLSKAAVAALRSGRMRIVSLAGAVPRPLSGLVDQVPATLWDIDRMLGDGTLAVDVFVGRFHATGSADRLSYGQMVGYSPAALSRAARAGFEVAPPVPGPQGPTVPAARADVTLVAGRVPRAAAPAGSQLSGELALIGARLAALIPAGSTLQVGLGTVPEALISQLPATADLVLHSGILPAGAAAALAEGRLRRQRPDGGCAIHVATGVMPVPAHGPGWPDSVHLLPVSCTHAPTVLGSIASLWAVNSAFEIDLSGQVNAEYLGGARVASAGGQVDFFRGAQLSPGGAAVLAFPSRTRSGRARIRAALEPPAVAAATGDLLDYVVTEQGTAALRGLTVAERREALIAVAHPDDRRALRGLRR